MKINFKLVNKSFLYTVYKKKNINYEIIERKKE